MAARIIKIEGLVAHGANSKMVSIPPMAGSSTGYPIGPMIGLGATRRSQVMIADGQVLTKNHKNMLDAVGKQTTIAMITRNEERAVGKVIGDIQKAMPDAEIVIVDSSSDRTAQIAEALGAHVIKQFPPRGYGPAMDRALHASDREVVVTLDCDDTYPVEFIAPMARMVLEDGYDLVDGSRLAGKPGAMPWINYLANWGFAFLASLAFLHRIRDLHSGMRAYRRSLIDRLHYETHGAALPVELLLRPIREGYKVKVITIPYRPRIGESTMRPLQSAWWTLKRICRSRFA